MCNFYSKQSTRYFNFKSIKQALLRTIPLSQWDRNTKRNEPAGEGFYRKNEAMVATPRKTASSNILAIRAKIHVIVSRVALAFQQVTKTQQTRYRLLRRPTAYDISTRETICRCKGSMPSKCPHPGCNKGPSYVWQGWQQAPRRSSVLNTPRMVWWMCGTWSQRVHQESIVWRGWWEGELCAEHAKEGMLDVRQKR